MELKKEVTPSLLLDFYGQTLTGKQREVMELYYNEDLSLSEIAENQKISRQAALDSIRRAEKHLDQMEQKLGMLEKYRICMAAVQEIERLAKGGQSEQPLMEQIEHIRAVWGDN
ncbi:MAG: YlxM family DNA-binding protein [Clostridiales bacterium]|nr:YlxM family DNA-binding protein [Clostridiales bacterium]